MGVPNDEELSIEKKFEIKKNRSCTDILCLIIFFIFVSGSIAITVLCFMDHGLYRLIYGFDSFGNICNRVNKKTLKNETLNGLDLTGSKYVLYFDYENPKTTTKVCVKTCPNVRISTLNELKSFNDKYGNLCLYNTTIRSTADHKRCPKLPIYITKPVMNRCLPPMDEILANKLHFKKLVKYLSEEWAQQTIIEIYKQIDTIGILAVIAVSLSIILVFLLRYIAKIMVYVIIIVTSLGTIALTIFLWFKYDAERRANNNIKENGIFNIEITSKDSYLAYSIIATVVTLIFHLILLILRKRIGLVVKLFAEAQKALKSMPLILIMPMLTFIFYFIFLTYWLLTSLLLASFGRYGVIEELTETDFSFHSIKPFMWCYHIFALIWISEFIFACEAIVVSGAVSKWYFTRDKDSLGSPVFASFKRLIGYHLGSAAFGSLVITFFKIPRYILMYLQDKIKATNSKFLQYVSKCCICCLYCLENFMKYINYNAYTIINIEGKSFCPATKKAFLIVVENSLRVSAINSVGDFMLFLAKLAVTVVTLIIAVFMFKIPLDSSFSIEELKFQGAPLLIVCVISYLIASCFFTIYENVIDAIMVCFCVDCKANDGSEDRPYYMSKSLRKFVTEADTTKVIIDN